jgi:hypothetical protein
MFARYALRCVTKVKNVGFVKSDNGAVRCGINRLCAEPSEGIPRSPRIIFCALHRVLREFKTRRPNRRELAGNTDALAV